MSMIPFFPNLKPSLSNRFWCDMPSDDEVQTKRYEDERKNWVCSVHIFMKIRKHFLYFLTARVPEERSLRFAATWQGANVAWYRN